MSTTTPLRNWRVPSLGDPENVPGDVARFASDVETDVVALFKAVTSGDYVALAIAGVLNPTQDNPPEAALGLGRVVTVRGQFSPKNGFQAGGSYGAVVTLPDGMHPERPFLRIAATNNPTTFARLIVNTNGTVDLNIGSAPPAGSIPTTIDISCLSGFRALPPAAPTS